MRTAAIDAVINVDAVTQVLTYDPTVEGGWLAAVRVNGAFEGGLTNIDATKSYLGLHDQRGRRCRLTYRVWHRVHKTSRRRSQLHKGWNMVPASSLDPDFPARDIDSYLSGVSWSRGYYYDADGRLTGFIPTIGEDDDDELVVRGRGSSST